MFLKVHQCWELYFLEQHLNEEILGEPILALLAALLSGSRAHDLKVALAGCLWASSESSILNAMRMTRGGLKNEKQTTLASLSRCLLLHLERARSRKGGGASSNSADHELQHYLLGAMCSLVQCAKDDHFIFGIEERKEKDNHSPVLTWKPLIPGERSGVKDNEKDDDNLKKNNNTMSSVSSSCSKSGFILRATTQSLCLHSNHISLHSTLNILEHVLYSADVSIRNETRRQFIIELDGIAEIIEMITSNIKNLDGQVDIHVLALRGLKICSAISLDEQGRLMLARMDRPSAVIRQLVKILDISGIITESKGKGKPNRKDIYPEVDPSRPLKFVPSDTEKDTEIDTGTKDSIQHTRVRDRLTKPQLEMAEHVSLLCYGISSGVISLLLTGEQEYPLEDKQQLKNRIKEQGRMLEVGANMLDLLVDWLYKHEKTTFLSQSHQTWMNILCAIESFMFVESFAASFSQNNANLRYLLKLLNERNLVTNITAERVALLLVVIARHPTTRPDLLATGVRSLIISLFDSWEEKNSLPRSFSRSTMRKLSLVVGMCCNCQSSRQNDERILLRDVESIKDAMVDTDGNRPLRDSNDVLLRLVGVISLWSLTTQACITGSEIVINAIGQKDTVERLCTFLQLFGHEQNAFDNENSNISKVETTKQGTKKGSEENKTKEETEEKTEEERLKREKLEKWNQLEEQAENRLKMEDENGDVDMTKTEVGIALRALVETSAGLLLSILATSTGSRAALSSSTVIDTLLLIAKKAAVMISKDAERKEESYACRVCKMTLGCLWNLLRHAPKQEYPRYPNGTTSSSMVSYFSRMLLKIRFIDDLKIVVENDVLSPSVRILACEFRSLILFSNAVVQINHGTTHRDHSHKFHHLEQSQQIVQDNKDTTHLLFNMIQHKQKRLSAILVSYASMCIAREAYKPHLRTYITSLGVIPILLLLLKRSKCGRLDTYLLHALMNLSAGEIEQKILGTKNAILLLLSCVEKSKKKISLKDQSKDKGCQICYEGYAQYRSDVHEFQDVRTTWTTHLKTPSYSHILKHGSPHVGYQSGVFGARVLHNLAKHKSNRSVLYKIELSRAATYAKKKAPAVTVPILRFNGNSLIKKKPKDQITNDLRQKFNHFLDEIGANDNNDKDDSTRTATTATTTSTMSIAPTMIPNPPPQRGAVATTLRKPLSSIWKEESKQESFAMNKRHHNVHRGLKEGTVGRTRFDMHHHHLISDNHPSARSIRAMPSMTTASRRHPRSKRWRPAISNIGVVKEALESTKNTNSTSSNNNSKSPFEQQQISSSIASPRVEHEKRQEERRGSTILLSAGATGSFKGKSVPVLSSSGVRGHMWKREIPSQQQQQQQQQQQASSGVTALTASDTTAIALEPQSPRHMFKFRTATVNRILVVCFELVLYGYGANSFDDFVQRAFLKALQIRLNLDEDLALGCHLATTKSGAQQHSPYRVRIHVSVEASENGHDVAEELMSSIEEFRNVDIGRSGHQKKSIKNAATTTKHFPKESPPNSPTSPKDENKNDCTRSFVQIFIHELETTHLSPHRNIELLSMSQAHKAFEDAAIFGALDPDADVSLGLWKHVKGSTISSNLFPKFTSPNGQEFFLYTKKKLHDLGCPHSDPMECIKDAKSMEEHVLLLDKVVTTENLPLPDVTTKKLHSMVRGDQHEVPEPPTHLCTIPTPHNSRLRGTIPMEDDRLLLIASIAHRPKPMPVPVPIRVPATESATE